jgi:hypothetical protein
MHEEEVDEAKKPESLEESKEERAVEADLTVEIKEDR